MTCGERTVSPSRRAGSREVELKAMADNTKIEWTDASWNPIVGCSIESPGCTNCYAMKDAWRKNFNPKTPQYHGLTHKVNGKPVWTGEVRFVERKLLEPLSWQKSRMIFVNSMSDLFHENVSDEEIDRIVAVMMVAHWHIFQPLTKRSKRMRDYLLALKESARWLTFPHPVFGKEIFDPTVPVTLEEALAHVWWGFTAEDQRRFDLRWHHCRDLAAAGWMIWLSAEPLLEGIDITPALWNFKPCDNCPSPDPKHGISADCCRELDLLDGPKWVVVGGESGSGARPMHPEWARKIRDDCKNAGVPFLFKQWGDWLPWERAALPCWRSQCGQIEDRYALFPSDFDNDPNWDDGLSYIADRDDHVVFQRVGKRKSGRELDSVTHDAFPEIAA